MKIRLLLVACLALTGCAQSETFDTLPEETSVYVPMPEGMVKEKAGSQPAQQILTTNLLGSLRPDDKDPKERVPEVIARGRLIVGVDQSQNLLSFRNPVSGNIEGLEVDIAKAIAEDIFGSPGHIEFRFINSSNWIEFLESGQIDIAMRGISITRSRQDQVFFSTPYLTARTRMLVEQGSNVASLEDLDRKTVCVTSGSTGLERVRAEAPTTDILMANSAADCLIALQQFQADAVISDDTILSGMAAQDPLTEVVGESLGEENYGIAIAKPGTRHHTEGLIRQVNASLERIFASGEWRRIYNRWFATYLEAQNPPPVDYRKETRDE